MLGSGAPGGLRPGARPHRRRATPPHIDDRCASGAASITDAVRRVLSPYDQAFTSPVRRRVHLPGPARHYPGLRVLVEAGILTDQHAYSTGLSWSDIIDAENRSVPFHASSPDRIRLDPDGRAYRRSGANPVGRFDYRSIGGSAHAAIPATTDPGSAAWSWCAERRCGRNHPGRIDACRRDTVDVAVLASEVHHDAADAFDRAAKATTDAAPGHPWPVFLARVETEPGYSLDEAVADYTSQPRYTALADAPLARCGDPIAILAAGREAYLASHSGFENLVEHDLVDLDGDWQGTTIPAFSTHPLDLIGLADHRRSLAAYLEALPAEALLVGVDCHR